MKLTAVGISALYGLNSKLAYADKQYDQPNLLFVLTDQWRAQDLGYTGNPDVETPNLDAFAAESVNYSNAVSTTPVCCPYRASMITGQYPLTHGLILNDLQLNTNATSIAEAYNQAGYMTGFIGKWHIDGNGRTSYIPQERRQGFKYFKALECTHDYNNSYYYDNNNPTRLKWPGEYDAEAQTNDAVNYLNHRADDQSPFALVLSWGPPHPPFRTDAPSALLSKYDSRRGNFTLRDNIPAHKESTARSDLAGYYAHIEALDNYFGQLIDTLSATGLAHNTIVVFTSDHGELLWSHGQKHKQQPWDESICVPFLIRVPGAVPKIIDAPIGTPDIMPTMLGLSGIPIPGTCEGQDLSDEIRGTVAAPEDRAALITCPAPFGLWDAFNDGGYEYRGVRTKRYTYVRDLNGPRLLFDNLSDPYQMNNLVNHPDLADIQDDLEQQLQRLLCKTGDTFQTRQEIVSRCGYKVDGSGTVAYGNSSYWGQVSVPCNDPVPLNQYDVSGPNGLPDCAVDKYDLAGFVEKWLNYPDGSRLSDFSGLANYWLF